MIGTQLAAQLQPLLCTAIASLIEDEHEATITAHPVETYGGLAHGLQQVGADISVLAAALDVIARWSVEGADTSDSPKDC